MAEENDLNGKTYMHEATTSSRGALETETVKSSGQNGKQQDSEKSKEEGKPSTVPFHKLFSFADSTDMLLMITGTIGAAGNGICMPLMAILFGDLIDSFGQNQNNKDVVDIVSKVKFSLTFVSLGTLQKIFQQLLRFRCIKFPIQECHLLGVWL